MLKGVVDSWPSRELNVSQMASFECHHREVRMEIPTEQGGGFGSAEQCHAFCGLETGPPLTKTQCAPLQHAFTRVKMHV